MAEHGELAIAGRRLFTSFRSEVVPQWGRLGGIATMELKSLPSSKVINILIAGRAKIPPPSA
jgi:hypothetical protein